MVTHGEKIWVTRYGSNNARLVKDSVGRGWCVEGNHANIGAIFDGSLDGFERPRAISTWTVIHNCHDQSINGVFGGSSLQGNENKLSPGMLAFAGSSRLYRLY